MNAEILDDLKSRYGDRVLLSPSDLAVLLGISEGQQANLRSAGKFPMPTRKVGAAVRVSIYDLAKYLSGEAESAASSAIKTTDMAGRIAKKKAKGRLEKDWWLNFHARVFAVLDKVRVSSKVKAIDKELETFKV